ncbi:MAG: hypothetical protein IT406_00655 [Candidatus Yanofskybacteria bacterium]|nr:hypothetical protein [Candidatus Yanofskybacteria bacterium]
MGCSRNTAREEAQLSKRLLSQLKRLTQQRVEAEEHAIEADETREELMRLATIDIVREIPLVCGHCENKSTLHRWRFIFATRAIFPFTNENVRYTPASLGECLLTCPLCGALTTVNEHEFGKELVALFSKFQNTRLALFDQPTRYHIGTTFVEDCPW